MPNEALVLLWRHSKYSTIMRDAVIKN